MLEYNTPLTNATADTVFGQGGSFTTDSQCNYDSDIAGVSTANDLCDPAGVAVDGSGNLYVADKGNNRVLEYNTPLTSDTTADRVLGQDDFTHNAANLMDAQGLNLPDAVAIDASATPNRVYVADEDNNRVLGWSDADLVHQRRCGRPGDWTARFPLLSVQRRQRYGQRQQPVLSTGSRGGRVGQPLRGG